MATRIMILIYIATILAISGSVKAATASAAFVESATINQSTGILTATAQASTPCQTQLAIVPHTVDLKAAVVVLDVISTSAPNAGEVCIQSLGAKYDLVYDLKDLHLIPGKGFSVKFLHYAGRPFAIRYIAQPTPPNVDDYKINKKSVHGVLVYFSRMAQPGRPGFAIENRNQAVPVVSPDINLSDYQNRQVAVTGYIVKVGAMNEVNNSGEPVFGDREQVSQILVPVSLSVSR